MREEDKRQVLIEEIEGKLAKLLSAGHLTENDKVSVLKEILALTMNEEAASKEA